MREYIEQLEKKGYCVILQAYTADQIKRALDLTRWWYENGSKSVSTNVPYLNRNHPIVYNLQNKDWYFLELLFACKPINEILRYFLNDPWFKQIPPDKPNYILRAYSARSSNYAMPLHIDSFVPSRDQYVISMQYAIVLEDQSTRNGCTVVVPGSHRSGEYATQEAYKDAIPIESKAGDIVIWDSRLWHATTDNTTSNTRWAFLATYSRWWLKQHFNIPASLPDEFYHRLTDEQRAVMGFCSIPYDDEMLGIDMKRGYDFLPVRRMDSPSESSLNPVPIR